MNSYIVKYIDQCFDQFRQTQEILDLKEEISQNAFDRYNDCLKENMSEADAMNEVLDSLSGLDSLLREIDAEEVDNTSFHTTYRKYQKEHLSKEAYSYVGQVELYLLNASVNIYDSKDDNIYVSSEDDAFEIIEEEDRIVVKESPDYYNWIHDHELVIKLPEIKSLKIISKSGDVDIKNIEVNQVEIECLAGDLNAENVMSDNVKLDCKAGDIEWSSFDPIEGLNINTSGGDIDVEIASVTNGAIRTKGGDIDLRLHGDFKSITLESLGGDITAILEVDDIDLEANSLGGEVKCKLPIQRGERKIKAYTMGGDIYIK